MNIKLTYMTNYNGWLVEGNIDSDIESQIEGALCDLSGQYCDEDGEFEYAQFSDVSEFLDKVNEIVGELCHTTIEYDRYST